MNHLNGMLNSLYLSDMNTIRIIHTFMEDYRCQLADFVNIRHLTDKSMSVNGNERNHPRNFCGSTLI